MLLRNINQVNYLMRKFPRSFSFVLKTIHFFLNVFLANNRFINSSRKIRKILALFLNVFLFTPKRKQKLAIETETRISDNSILVYCQNMF